MLVLEGNFPIYISENCLLLNNISCSKSLLLAFLLRSLPYESKGRSSLISSSLMSLKSYGFQRDFLVFKSKGSSYNYSSSVCVALTLFFIFIFLIYSLAFLSFLVSFFFLFVYFRVFFYLVALAYLGLAFLQNKFMSSSMVLGFGCGGLYSFLLRDFRQVFSISVIKNS